MYGKVIRFGDRESLRQVSEVWECYSWTMSSDISRFDEVKKRSQRIALRSGQGAFEENQEARLLLAEAESLHQIKERFKRINKPGLSWLRPSAYAELYSSEEKARRACVNMAATAAFSVFDHGHQGLVLAVDFNFFGTWKIVASSVSTPVTTAICIATKRS
ncbi:hypothetical protein HDK77DRAFT_487869 [Phyllosticta capitalensis]